MHRSQILLEDWQYEQLKARAERQGKSISEVVRNLISREMKEGRSNRSKLSQLRGIGSSDVNASDAKEMLYMPEKSK